ncbi:BamA/TamA family outer membrane protein [Wenzhouxiangella sp. AB-CW3]|uniref:autotransporter assembly complex protein TamA n=1 Tax=Wenzhouxiangella sp. AB-CW3 TaxID=2771012 RepID=UPI00168C0D2D|nr:BamA/TamA family outer membrane protein [Wenzhouxiangella sp. AB-CW3]QOC22248.1 BamA/TamA family outer membrane protein [Wenzhouxiangella sp. AB-CW3]
MVASWLASLPRLLIVALLALSLSIAVRADSGSVVTEVSGISGELLENVRLSVSLVRAESLDEISVWRLRQMATDARSEVREALRPFGYYRPRVEVRLDEPETEGDPWRATLRVEPGRPVRVHAAEIRITGEGADDPELKEWQAEWPLPEDAVLRHEDWSEAWRDLERLAERRGYFDAHFVARRIEVDPDRNRADLRLVYDTGPRYRFGTYRARDADFSDRLINRLTIVEPGEAYDITRVDEQREALVRAGLFRRVIIEEERDSEEHVVDLDYQLETRPPNTYRATAGFGTDTGARLQLGWERHYLSRRGNRLDSALGLQQRNNEMVARSEYQHPRGSTPSDFLTAGMFLRREQDNFRFIDENRLEPVFDAFEGRREQSEISFGRMQERGWLPRWFQPVEERLSISVLHESFDAFREARFSEENEALLAANPDLEELLRTSTDTISVGARWRLPNISGSGFHTQGQVLRAHVIAAHESLGSPVSFTQGYLGGRWHHLFGDRHKLLLRGELGYTEARTREMDLTLDDRQLELSLTELPERYRFRTGGDRSVRGYGFENLSTNRNGANHLVVGSMEYEYRVGESWSLAAFYDVGNAFNDLGNPKLRRGTGVGFRWYTLIGPIQLDIASPLDDPDTSWRLHFTIGTQLL